MGRPQSKAMTKALKAITERHVSPPIAAEKYGVALNGIYRKQEYKDYIKKKKESTNG